MKIRLALPSLLLVSACLATPPPGDLPTAKGVDLARYQGRWYEIARLPHRFQKGCGQSIADYRLAADGSVLVTNSCPIAGGRTKTARGIARAVDDGDNAKLEVVFDNLFFRLFSRWVKGDYWILRLDPDYRYALVGGPSRSHLWILARERQLPPATLRELVEQARGLGFPTEKLILHQP